MRVNWILPAGIYINHGEILNACHKFYEQYKIVPDTVKLTYNDFHQLMHYMPQQAQVHEVGKEYKQMLPVPGGFVEMQLLEETDEIFSGSNIVQQSIGTPVNQFIGQPSTQQSMFVVECHRVDREFERQVLKS